MRSALLALLITAVLALNACQSAPVTCVPDGSPPCECMPGDSRDCTADAGMPGLQACGNSGQWTICEAFQDGAPQQYDATAVDQDFYDLGPRDRY